MENVWPKGEAMKCPICKCDFADENYWSIYKEAVVELTKSDHVEMDMRSPIERFAELLRTSVLK